MIEATRYLDVTDPIELTALARALRRAAPGALLVARVNAPALREEIRRWLMENGGRPLRPVELTDDRSILSQLKEADGEAAGDAALSVFGLESLPDLSLARFNRERAGLGALKHPVLLWVSEHGLHRLLEHAPDVFDWHSGFYELVSTREMQLLEALPALAEWDTPMWVRGPEERRRRIRELEAILQDYREAGDRVDLTGDLLRVLGTLYREEGEIGQAKEALREALAIFQSVGHRAGMAQTLHNLGVLAQDTGDYAEARRLYGEALEVERQLGDRAGIAATLHNLGVLAQQQGDYAEARRLYGEALEMARQVGDRASMAQTLHNLGVLAQQQGDTAEARWLYGEAAETFRQLGAQREQAAVLHNLGMLAQDTGDTAEARRLYGEALEMARQVGDRAGIAQTLHNLGMLAQDTGDTAEARRLYGEALAILAEIDARLDVGKVREILETVRQMAEAAMAG